MGIRATSAVQSGSRVHAEVDGTRQSSPSQGEQLAEAAGLRERLTQALARVNQMVSEEPRRLSFELHEGAGRIVVRVIDLETNEVIRQVPPEQVLGSLARLREIVGLLLDQLA